LTAAQVVGDVDAGENPYLAWSDVDDEEFSCGGDAVVGEEEAANSVSVRCWDWLRPR
jgi:hypothetical protein